MLKRDGLIPCILLIVALVAATGCGATRSYSKADTQMRRGNYDEAVLGYSKAVALKPGNAKFTLALERAKLKAAGAHFDKGRRYTAAKQWDLAIAEYQQTLLLAPGFQHAANELQRAIRELQRLQAVPSELEILKERARNKDLGPPRLDPSANIPILLNFTDTEVGKIFEAIGKASGINFIFDEKTDLNKPMTIDIGNVSLEKALDILMLQTKNFYKVIDDYTLLVAPDTRQKRQEYEDQVIRTFFLSNADTKQVVTLLRSLLQSRQIAENADLNSVTIKDTPDKVAIAERIIGANDKSKGEVLIDVELLEINRTLAKTIGLDLSSKTLSLTFRDGAQTVPLNNLDSLKQAGNWTVGVIPSVLLSFLKSDSDTKLIAKPQLRVSEGEQAEILIGDRVPIPTTSFNTSQTIGGNIVPITSFTYQNVGINVQMEPRVHHNKEVTLRIQVEISQITGAVSSQGGQAQPIIGTRQIQTVIRLRDGETNMLAGLIQKTNTDTRSGVAGISDIPGLRRVFGSSDISSQETDIVLTMTPRIVRIPDITEDDLATLWVGTEDNMRLRGPARNALNQSPFTAAAGSGSQVAPPLPDPADAAGTRVGGSLAQITPSAAVVQEREADAARSARQPTEALVGGETPAAATAQRQSQRSSGVGRVAEPAPSDRSTQQEPPADDEPELRGPASVRLVPTKTVYTVGERVVVDIFIENAANVGSVPFHLRFNPQVLQFEGRTEGPFLKSDGTETVFLATPTPAGEVVVGHSRMGAGEGASGAGSLASFEFSTIGPGSCGFMFTGSSVKDPQARNLPAAFATVPVQVQP